MPGSSIGLGRGITVTAAAPPLAPSTTYHYRAVATNDLGQVTVGRDVAFTTAPDVSVIPAGVSIGGTAAAGSVPTAFTGAWSAMSPTGIARAGLPVVAVPQRWLLRADRGAVGRTYAVRGEDAAGVSG